MGKWPSDPSERAKALHAAGRFGGAEYGSRGGRPRKQEHDSAAAAVADAARRNADLIVKTLEHALKHGGSTAKLQAAKELLAAEQRHQQIRAQENELDHRQLSREEALALLKARMMADTPAGAIMRQQLLEPIDAEAVEIDTPST